MQIRTLKSMRVLTVLAAAITLSFGMPASASKSERNHNEKHSESHSESHTEKHNDDRHDNRNSDSSSQRVSAVLTAVGEPGARGKLSLKTKTRKTEFEGELSIPVPSTALAIADKTAARDVTFTLVLSRSDSTYAECDFDFRSFEKGRAAKAKFKLEVSSRRGVLQTRTGLCDIDLTTDGAQLGLPAVQAGDTAAITVDTNGASVFDGVFQ